MSKGSQRILKDISLGNRSASFSKMDRSNGYPSIRDRSAHSNTSNFGQTDRSHNVSIHNKTRDLSGNKISFLNSNSHLVLGSSVYSGDGTKLFSP